MAFQPKWAEIRTLHRASHYAVTACLASPDGAIISIPHCGVLYRRPDPDRTHRTHGSLGGLRFTPASIRPAPLIHDGRTPRDLGGCRG